MLSDIDDLLSAMEDTNSGLREYVKRMDLTRDVYVYMRQSKVSGNNKLYRAAQTDLAEQLIDAGVPRERLIVLAFDDGKSATLNEKYRDDYNRLKTAVSSGSVGTVVCIEISRLHRDPTAKQQTDMASLMSWKKVCVLTQNESQAWLWLDMHDPNANVTYRDYAAKAASEWGRIRARSMTSKIKGLKEGAASTGGTIPFGWRLVPGLKKAESPTGEHQPPRITIYKPHALIKLRMMRESLKPHIKHKGDLRRHLTDLGITIPPFDAALPIVVFNRSCMRNICRKIGGERVYLKRSETISDFGPAFLDNALLEPQVLGDVRFGSGVGGQYALAKQKEIADSMMQDCFSKITPGRVFAYHNRALALCRPENYDDLPEAEQDEWVEFPTYAELEELYRDVVRKWSHVDLIAARQDNYKTQPTNAERPARVQKGRPYGTANPWAGFVWCGNHGFSEDGPNLHETLKFAQHKAAQDSDGDYEQWQCSANQRDAETRGTLCQTWSGGTLRRVLNAHVKRRLHNIVQGEEQLFKDIFEIRQKAKADCEQLKRDIERLQTEQRRAMDKYDRYDRMLTDAPATERNDTLDTILRDEIKPLMAKLAELKSDYEQAVAAGADTDIEKTAGELKASLADCYVKFDTLPTERKRHLFGLLVENVVVYTGDGISAEESVILFTWKNLETEMLVTWRDQVRDMRPWTEAEDEAIKELWQSDCDFETLQERLLPGRKYNAMKRRAIAIEATGQKGKNRKVSLRDQAAVKEQSWHEQHPDVLYLIVENFDPESTVATYQQVYIDDNPARRSPYLKRAPLEVMKKVHITLERYSYPERAISGVLFWSLGVPASGGWRHPVESELPASPHRSARHCAFRVRPQQRSVWL